MRTPITQTPEPVSYLALYAATALPAAAIYVPVFGVLALIIAFNSKDSAFAWQLFFFGPAVLHGILVAMGQKKATEHTAEAWSKAWNSLGHVDYFYASADVGIAVDAQENKIAILKRASTKPKSIEITTVKIDEIKDYKYQVVTPAEYEAFGAYNTSGKLKAESLNFAEKCKASRNTGIVITPKGITSVEHLVSMDEKDIKVWMKILESAFAGELEPTERPVDTSHI